MHSVHGKLQLFSIDPPLNPGLGSGSIPKNLPLLLASTKFDILELIFSFICSIFVNKVSLIEHVKLDLE